MNPSPAGPELSSLWWERRACSQLAGPVKPASRGGPGAAAGRGRAGAGCWAGCIMGRVKPPNGLIPPSAFAAAGAGGESRQRRPLRGGRLGRALSHQGGPREPPHFPACPAPTPEPGWATGSRRMRVEQRDPAGEALSGGGHFGGASLRPVQLPRELSPGTRCGARGNPARIRRPGGAGPGTETRRGRPGRESREAAVTEQLQETPRPPEPPSGAGAGRGSSSRSDAVREPPAQGERALQAHPGE